MIKWNEWMNKKSKNERINMHEWLNDTLLNQNNWIIEWIKDWMNEWMDEWMNEWTNDWMKDWRMNA